MKGVNQIRCKCLTVRFTGEERTKLNRLRSKAHAGSVSEYARAVLLAEPVIIIYRNQSADDFLEEMILLKKELNAIGINFNQAVHKLHTLDHVSDIRAWALLNEATRKVFMNKVDEIKEKLQQIYELWSQK
jgi:hypothetical protein